MALALIGILCLYYCTRAMAGQFPAPQEFCCIFMCASVHELEVLMGFMLWEFWLTSEFFFPLNSWFSVMGAWVGGGCGGQGL